MVVTPARVADLVAMLKIFKSNLSHCDGLINLPPSIRSGDCLGIREWLDLQCVEHACRA